MIRLPATGPQDYAIPPNILAQDYGYKYPKGLNLKPGSDLHKKIIQEVMTRAIESDQVMADRHKRMRHIDATMTAYIKLDDEEKTVKADDERKPVSIVVPVSFAVRDVLKTYVLQAFTNERPIFTYEGVGPEDILGAAMLETLIDNHCAKTKVPLNLNYQFIDAITYGFGFTAPYWDVRPTTRPKMIEEPVFSDLDGSLLTTTKKRGKEVVNWEGNALENIDPYMVLPDPNVPLDQPQRGEYFGWVSPENQKSLARKESTEPREWFNCKYLKHIAGNTYLSFGQQRGGGRDCDRSPWEQRQTPSASTRPVDLVNMYIDLIPKEWELSDSDEPEKWLFTVAGDSIVVRAKPLGLYHGMFPVTCCAPESDGYSSAPTSRLSLVEGLQTAINFAFNSRIKNQRKSLNDMWVVDGSRINMNDVLQMSAGKIMRLRRAAHGMDVRNSIFQFPVADVTANNMQQVEFISGLLERIVGAPEILQGERRQTSERVSATEARDTRGAALTRLETMVKIISWQSMHDTAYMFASHTQQFMKEDVYIQSIGRNEDVFRDAYQIGPGRLNRIPVSPENLYIDYDVTVGDASVTKRENMQTYLQILDISSRNPETLQQVFVPFLKIIAQRLGIKDMRQFLNRPVNMQVVPDQQAMAMARNGNALPIGGLNGSAA